MADQTPSAAPVAAPSAPAASTPAPAPTPSPAPAAAPAATPSTPAVVPVTAGDIAGKSTLEAMQVMQAAAKTEPPAASEGEVPAATPAADSTPAPEAGQEEAKPLLEDESIAPTGEETPDGDDGEEEFNYEPNVALAPQVLNEKIEANPALKAALEADPELRSELFSNARLAAEATAFQEVFASPQDAKIASQGFSVFTGVSDLMDAQVPGQREGTEAVIAALREATFRRDAEGNPILGADGQPQPSGTLSTFLRNAFEIRLSHEIAAAQESGDADGLAAIEWVLEKVGIRQAAPQDEGELPENVVRARADIKAREDALKEQQTTQQKAATDSYNADIGQRLDTYVDKTVGGLLKNASGLSDYTRTNVDRDIRAALAKSVKASPTWKREFPQINAMPPGADRAKAHMALVARVTQFNLARVAQPILAEAGVSLKAQTAAQAARTTARAEAARSETRGTIAAGRPAAAPVPAAGELQKTVIAELTQKLGQAPTTFQVMQETSRRSLELQKAS